LPDFSWETVKLLVTPTLTIALLGAIESLLCARVADQLSHLPPHDPNQELMAQGIANFVVPFFGGMPVTGTIARTVTNLRAGATSPVAGIVHSVALAGIVLLAAPLALHVPLAVLAGILLFVAWNMGEWREFARLRSFSNHYRLILLGTFVVTIVFDLTVALEAGMVLACVLFVRRMSALFQVEEISRNGPALHYSLYGALFFGAVARLDPLLRAIEEATGAPQLTLDASRLIALDTTGLEALTQVLETVHAKGGRLHITHLNPQPRSLMERSGFAKKLEILLN
jgi:sulfate permease, SulP family